MRNPEIDFGDKVMECMLLCVIFIWLVVLFLIYMF